jgi:hypothetical protein
MANLGVAPPNFSTTVGNFRLLANDLYFVPTNPVVAGLGDYTLFSDNEIDAYLILQSNVYCAVGLAYMGLANTAARQAESIKDFDLAIDSRQKAEQLRAQADAFFNLADKADADSGLSFHIVDTGLQCPCGHELAEHLQSYCVTGCSGLIV